MQTLRVSPLVLEPLTVAHAAQMFALLSEPELYRYLGYGPPPSLEHVQTVYGKLEARWSPDGTEQWLNWVIREPGGELAGFVQATVESSGRAWVAYVLGRERWGRGYATLATRCMMQHLQSDYGVTHYLATVEQSNAASIAVLARLGFAAASEQECAQHELTSTERLFVLRDAADIKH
jgi:[ribosomal protein S5]-alanine N-acetyltransferase